MIEGFSINELSLNEYCLYLIENIIFTEKCFSEEKQII